MTEALSWPKTKTIVGTKSRAAAHSMHEIQARPGVRLRSARAWQLVARKINAQIAQIDIPNQHNRDNPRLGSTRPDISFWLDRKKTRRFHINTASMLVDGTTPTKRERHQLEKLSRLGQRVARAMPKLRPGMDEDEYAKLARDVCRDILKDAKDTFDDDNADDE